MLVHDEQEELVSTDTCAKQEDLMLPDCSRHPFYVCTKYIFRQGKYGKVMAVPVSLVFDVLTHQVKNCPKTQMVGFVDWGDGQCAFTPKYLRVKRAAKQ